MVHSALVVHLSFVALFLLVIVAADLRADLLEFSPLIPRRRIGFIAARYFARDARFRTAVEYTRSPDFAQTWQRMRKTPEIEELLNYVTNNGTIYDLTNLINRVPEQVKSFEIPTEVPVEMIMQKDLTSFLREVLNALPRARISSLMARKVKEGGDYAKVYRNMRDNRFRELLYKARNSKNLSMPLRKFQRNFINVDELIEIGFSLLKWGP